MPTLTMILNGELEELNPYLQLISEVSGKSDPRVATVRKTPNETNTAKTQDSSRTDWTLDEFIKYWGRLSKNAKVFLKELSKKPAGYHAPELKQSTGLDTKNLSGACKSAGGQIRHIDKNKSKVFDRDEWKNNGHVYTMPKAIADYVLQLP